TVKLTVNGKQYEVNCGIIRAENDSSANTGSALMTGMSTTPVVGPYRAGYPKATSSSILTLKAREQVTVTDIALRSATGLAEIENCSVTITDADGLATTTAWEKGDAFSVPAGGEISISAMIYDPAAKDSIYAASMAVSVTYKTADGRTRRQSRQIQLVSNTSVYLMSLQQFDGVNMHAFYKYVYNPLHLNREIWAKEYGYAYPEAETTEQFQDYLAEFFKEK
ncbi:MAG: hypothetical protein II794_02840, partial [Oscillospiraceae bacterium]|nr:hypothetical protein [Oscillospiraceae bacterium]